MHYAIMCEVEPGIIARFDTIKEAIKAAYREAEDYYWAAGSSQYIMVKDEEFYSYHAVRYTPENGGTFHIPEEYLGVSFA